MIQVGIIPAKLVVTMAKGMPARKNCIFFGFKNKERGRKMADKRTIALMFIHSNCLKSQRSEGANNAGRHRLKTNDPNAVLPLPP